MTVPDVGRSGVQAVARAVQLLEVVAAADSPPTMQTLAAALGCAPSTAHRIVVTLSRAELLHFDPVTKRYSLGAGISRLAQRRADQVDLATLAQPVMDRVRAQTEETVTLWVRSSTGAEVCVAVSESPREIRQHVGVGSRATLRFSAGSRVLVAGEDPAAVRTWAAEAGDGTDRATIGDDVRRARSGGLVTVSGAQARRLGLDVGTMAAPVFGADGRVVAAFVVAGPAERFTTARMNEATPAVRAAAREVTTAAGGHPVDPD